MNDDFLPQLDLPVGRTVWPCGPGQLWSLTLQTDSAVWELHEITVRRADAPDDPPVMRMILNPVRNERWIAPLEGLILIEQGLIFDHAGPRAGRLVIGFRSTDPAFLAYAAEACG